MQAAAARGCGFIGVGPLRDDMPAEARAEWLAITPNTDTALMLAIMHTLVAAGLHDRAFLDRYTVGWPVLEAYLLGREDGQPKDAAWAAPITGIAADRITALARRLAASACWSPSRIRCSAPSMASSRSGPASRWPRCWGRSACPAAASTMRSARWAHTGRRYNAVSTAALPQGRNRVGAFIPVARISDMLLNPGRRLRVQRPAR